MGAELKSWTENCLAHGYGSLLTDTALIVCSKLLMLGCIDLIKEI